MTLPLRFTPTTVADSLDSNNSPQGVCQALTNLIEDPTTPGVYQCRPAAVVVNSFSGFTTPGVVSCAYNVDGLIFGLVASGLTPGCDEPFCYDIAANTFLTVTGVTPLNVPTTFTTVGEWTPPTMDQAGVNLIVTHPGFNGINGYFGWFNLSDPRNPVWSSGTTTTNPLPGVPQAVRQLNGRAYFAVANQLWYTDALTLTITNASQFLVVGDSGAITALSPLSLNTTSQGILGGLLAFKESLIAQITGDAALNTLMLSVLSNSVGTTSPLSVVSTPQGVYFRSDDGLRLVDMAGNVGDRDQFIRIPLIYAVYPSRVVASFGAGIYRIGLTNGYANSGTAQEYWLDTVKGTWSGPHTFVPSVVVAHDSTFYAFQNDNSGKIYRADPNRGLSPIYVENSAQMTFIATTAPLQDTTTVFANSAILTTINMALSNNGQTYAITAFDEEDNLLSTATLTSPISASLWGSFLWGTGTWVGLPGVGLKPRNIPWTKPLVFTKMYLQITGNCADFFRLSNMQIEYEPLNYVILQ
jgi:hypothetical protein